MPSRRLPETKEPLHIHYHDGEAVSVPKTSAASADKEGYTQRIPAPKSGEKGGRKYDTSLKFYSLVKSLESQKADIVNNMEQGGNGTDTRSYQDYKRINEAKGKDVKEPSEHVEAINQAIETYTAIAAKLEEREKAVIRAKYGTVGVGNCETKMEKGTFVIQGVPSYPGVSLRIQAPPPVY